MSDRKVESALQVLIVASAAHGAQAAAAGFKSIRVVSQPEDLYQMGSEGYEIDATLAIFTRYVLALPPEQTELRDALAVRLGDTKCRWVEWPIGTQSPEALREALNSSRPMWTDEVATIDDIPDPGPEKTYETGFKKLDHKGIRFVKPAFMSVIGPYGSGKSVLLRQLSVNLWQLHGWRTLITSFEERVKPRMQRDLRRHIIGCPIEMWDDKDIAEADDVIRKAFRFLRRSRTTRLDLDRLLNRIEYAVQVYGVDVVIIDPVNEIDHSVPKHQSKTDYMGDFIMALKALADDYNLLVICAAHPPKDGVAKRFAKGQLLTLNDGADTSHWGNKSDIGWCVWRPNMEGPTLLHIDKVKDYETMGKPTLAELELDAARNKFEVTRMGYDIIGDLQAEKG
jgi:archaellum biogenesis ATPase FlaH